MRGRLGTRIFLGMLAILGVNLLSAPVALDIIQTFGERELVTSVARAAETSERYLQLRTQALEATTRTLSEVPHLRATFEIPNLDAETASQAVRQIAIAAGPRLILAFDDNGKFLASSRPLALGVEVTPSDAVLRSVRQGEALVGVWTVGDMDFLACSCPVVAGGATLGILTVGEPIDEDFVRQLRAVTGTNIVTAHGFRWLTKTHNDEFLAIAGLADLGSARNFSFGDGTGTRITDLCGAQCAVHAAPILKSDVDVILYRPTAVVADAQRKLLGSLGACLAVTTAITLFLGRVLSRRIARPILQLTKATQEMAERQTIVDVGRGFVDEIGVLSRSITTMARRILDQKARELEVHAARERALLAAKIAAEDANNLKGEFLANISHELRTPLHGVLSFAQMGRARIETAGPQKLLSYFDQIDKSAHTLLRLVNDLLDMTKLDADGGALEKTPVDARQIVASVVDEMRSLTEQSNIRLDVSVPAVPCIVRAATGRIEQVLRNLIANAIRFAPRGSAVEVAATPSEADVEFSVRDQGPGVPEAELERIFDKFVQSSRTKDGSGGTGLGLAISRKIVTAHGGRIWADNHAAGGAVFRFVLPLAHAPVGAPA